MEVPYGGEATINEIPDGVELIIPVKKNWTLISYLCFPLAITCFILMVLGHSFFDNFKRTAPPIPFLVIFLLFSVFSIFTTIRNLRWLLFGREVITFKNGVITIEKNGALFVKSVTYDLNEAVDFRVQDDGNDYTNNFWYYNRYPLSLIKNSGGVIRFDYGLKTIKFGNGIDEAEAKFILKKLRDKKILTDSNFIQQNQIIQH